MVQRLLLLFESGALSPPPVVIGRPYCCPPFVSLSPPLFPSIMCLSSVSASVAQSIRLHGQGPSGAFIRCSLSLSLLCSFPHSLVAVLPIKIQSSVVRLHYT